MKERPILFSAPMVRAILEGRKTQTRRVIKPQPTIDTSGNFCWNGWNFGQDFNGPHIQAIASPIPSSKTKRVHCPYGKAGDRLWVRETWQGPLLDSEEHEAQFHDDGPKAFQKPGFCAYRATDNLDAIGTDGNEIGWRPSIHMPRWACRILLEITGIRVELLADLSKDDAMAEGIVIHPDGGFGLADSTHYNFSDPTDSFCSLWESINGAGSWMANPWVWVIEFKQVKETA